MHVALLITMDWRRFSGLVPMLLACDLVLCQYPQQSWYRQQPDYARWGSYQQPDTMRWGPYQTGWGSASGIPQVSRQMPNPPLRTVSVECLNDKMVVTVLKDLFGTGALVKASDLTLGTAQCTPSSEGADTVIFQVNLQDCGNSVQMNADFILYSSNVAYKPSPARNVPITRTNSANIGVQCVYPRYGNVSSKPIEPTWIPFSTTVSMEERLSFALYLMNDAWSGQSNTTIFPLGSSLKIEASVNVDNHVPMRLYVDSCLALLAPDPKSTPQYALINNHGCLVDGQLEDSSSTFMSPRAEPNRLRFQIDAFKFTDNDQPTIYIYCMLKAVLLNQAPDPTNKACSFSKASNSWSPVEGTGNICSCCDTGNCGGSLRRIPPAQPRRIVPGQPRRHWKRHQADEESEVIHAQLLGPIWIIDAKSGLGSDCEKSLALHAEPEEVKPWMVVAVGALWVCVVLGALITWKIRSRKCNATKAAQ